MGTIRIGISKFRKFVIGLFHAATIKERIANEVIIFSFLLIVTVVLYTINSGNNDSIRFIRVGIRNRVIDSLNAPISLYLVRLTYLVTIFLLTTKGLLRSGKLLIVFSLTVAFSCGALIREITNERGFVYYEIISDKPVPGVHNRNYTGQSGNIRTRTGTRTRVSTNRIRRRTVNRR